MFFAVLISTMLPCRFLGYLDRHKNAISLKEKPQLFEQRGCSARDFFKLIDREGSRLRQLKFVLFVLPGSKTSNKVRLKYLSLFKSIDVANIATIHDCITGPESGDNKVDRL